jgi:asparagine synthase (glutamine-hydrolysing)
MCGIFAYFCRTGQCVCHQKIVQESLKIQHRGPDETHIIHSSLNTSVIDDYHLVFHRLMINGLSPESGQPLVYPPNSPTTYLICNGEIYNYRELIAEHKFEHVYHSGSDCEIILHMYHKFGLKETLLRLRGEFAFVLIDLTLKKVMIARDPLGVRSMYYSADEQGYGIASELKALYNLAEPSSIKQFPGGCYGVIDQNDPVLNITRYYDVLSGPLGWFSIESEDTICHNIHKLLIGSVTKRMMCDRTSNTGPAIGAYLSGGFDSSMVAAILADHYPGTLRTFSIGFEGSPDLLNARIVAEYIGSQHYEYVITEQQALNALRDVTRQIESYDVTTNRASVFMYLLSKEIRRVSDVAVVLSGEGADEAFGSYMYFHKAPNHTEFHDETLRLLKDLQYFDLLRGDKSSAVAGLELRVPYLDIDFIEYVKTIDPKLKLKYGIEKYILRKAMSSQYGTDKKGRQLLPDVILWRTKEAMSDGVSLHCRSWSTVIQEYLTDLTDNKYVVQPITSSSSYDPAIIEKEWFKRSFSSIYPGCEDTIPYDWLPKWCGDVKDASARVLDIYRDRMSREGNTVLTLER